MKFPRSLSGVILDFFILLIIFSVVLFSIAFCRSLLFRETSHPSELTFITEAMPIAFEGKISEGDTVYDTLTKRKLGTISTVERIYTGGRVKFIITTSASFTPRSDALRTKSLWFRVKLEKETSQN